MAIPSGPGGENFATCYVELCKQQRMRPLPVICISLPYNLDFTTDRLKMDDWGPILSSLSLDRTLKSISIRSRHLYRKPLEEVNSEIKARAVGKASPVVLTRYLLEWLSHSVAQCVRNSTVLTSLELEGIPFLPDCVAVLCVGLAGTRSLRHLSFQRCCLGDSSCELICRTIADVQSVRTLNLSHCELSSKCGPALAAALSRQKLSLYHDTWMQSLRYREPNLEAMPGLRRLTLNGNPRLGDVAVSEIVDAIRDSLWLKALDLQHCGLTDAAGKDLLELLRHNSTLCVLDVRMNPNLNDSFVSEITSKLIPGDPEYSWLGSPEKDGRTSSSGLRKTPGTRDPVKSRTKITANTVRQSKRPCQGSRRTPPTPVVAKRTKMKPPAARDRAEVNENAQVEEKIPEVAPYSRPFLHLDLQAQIGSSEIKSVDERMKEENPADELLRKLTEARLEQERLLEETKRYDLLLIEEKARREMAELKLCAMKDTVAELEEALKEKERETRGFLLVSQQSLDEICSSFDRLFEMLDSVSRKGLKRVDSEEDSGVQIGADIKRRLAFLIRKTKSESLRRGYCLDGIKQNLESARKVVRSESDVRTDGLMPPLSHFERKIGDLASPTPGRESIYQPGDGAKLVTTPCERARAIFAQFINGDAVLNLGSYVC